MKCTEDLISLSQKLSKFLEGRDFKTLQKSTIYSTTVRKITYWNEYSNIIKDKFEWMKNNWMKTSQEKHLNNFVSMLL